MKIIIASCVIFQCALFLSVIDLQRARRDLEQKINVLAVEVQLVNIHSNMCHDCAELKK